MSYLETLNSHNTQIQNLINKANELPEAGGGGGSIELCTVTITLFGPSAGDMNVYYTNGSSGLMQVEITGASTVIEVMKNSFICTNFGFSNRDPDAAFIDWGPPVKLFFITDDATFNIMA